MTQAVESTQATPVELPRVPMQDWGKDHWSLLGYVGIRCADNRGVMNYDNLRINPNRRVPVNCPRKSLGEAGVRPSTAERWEPAWGTRLKGFFSKDDPKVRDTSRQLGDHDDIDCLHDMEAEGLIELGTYVSAFVKMTEKGSQLCGQLLAHKTQGGVFAYFEPKP